MFDTGNNSYTAKIWHKTNRLWVRVSYGGFFVYLVYVWLVVFGVLF